MFRLVLLCSALLTAQDTTSKPEDPKPTPKAEADSAEASALAQQMDAGEAFGHDIGAPRIFPRRKVATGDRTRVRCLKRSPGNGVAIE